MKIFLLQGAGCRDNGSRMPCRRERVAVWKGVRCRGKIGSQMPYSKLFVGVNGALAGTFGVFDTKPGVECRGPHHPWHKIGSQMP